MHDLIQELTDLLGAAGILTEASDRVAHEEDWRGRYRGEALCVALPKTTGDVSGIVMACARHGAAIVPQGGNTGLSGGSIPTTPNTVIISTRRMNRIETVDAVEGSMIVGAGCILMDIHAAAEAAGWVFRCIWALKALVRSAATSRPMPAAPRSSVTATRAT